MNTPVHPAARPPIGHAGPVFRGTIDRTRVRDFARALRLDNPIHFDVEAARAAGYRDVVAPPGFVISHSLQPRATKLGTFGIDEGRALAGEMGFQPLAVICAGDELSGRTVLVSLESKAGKRPMTAFGLETRFFDPAGQAVLVVNETLLQWEDA